MRALHISSFVQNLQDLNAKEIPFPDLKETSILIRISHVSPTHVDLLYARGLHQNNRRHAKPPMVLGSDFAGTIVRAPPSCGFHDGDRVFGSLPGAFAEFVAIEPAVASHGIRHIPSGWTAKQACAVGASGAISLGSFQRGGGVRPGMWVLVTGASGGLGVIAVQIAKHQGAKVIALVRDQEKAQPLYQLGVDHCVYYEQKDWAGEVRKLAGGEGVDLVYDSAGMVEQCLRACRYNGRVIVVGFAARNGDMERIATNRILLKGAAVVGYRFGEHARRDPAAVTGIWTEFNSMVSTGSILPVVFPKEYRGVEEIPVAMRDLADRKVWGRAVVTLEGVASRPTSRAQPKL